MRETVTYRAEFRFRIGESRNLIKTKYIYAVKLWTVDAAGALEFAIERVRV